MDTIQESNMEFELKAKNFDLLEEENSRLESQMKDMEIQLKLMRTQNNRLSNSKDLLNTELENKVKINLKLEESVRMKDYLTQKISKANQEKQEKQTDMEEQIKELSQLVIEQDLEK